MVIQTEILLVVGLGVTGFVGLTAFTYKYLLVRHRNRISYYSVGAACWNCHKVQRFMVLRGIAVAHADPRCCNCDLPCFMAGDESKYGPSGTQKTKAKSDSKPGD